ncbi:MAG: hypothetical protein HFE63_10205 [Clostridiales bacterium]|nr:hypothetical protein [Clostridiales bacterium]
MSDNNRCFGSQRGSVGSTQSNGSCGSSAIGTSGNGIFGGGTFGGNSISGGNVAGSVLIDTYQVFDSCRDRDCFEDTRVFLDEYGQSLIEHTGQVRTKCAEICSSSISVEPVQLSRGFYRITVRYYVKLELEACVCPGKPQCFTGLAVVEKTAVLYGGEGEVRVFRSNAVSDSFCSRPCTGEMSTNLPVAVVETVDPVILGTRVIDPSQCRCCCCCDDIPEPVTGILGGTIVDSCQKYLAVSLGFFSVIRLERPEQYLISAVESSVPEKECVTNDESSPCDAFSRMAFPIDEFSPGRVGSSIGTGCGCGGNSGCNSSCGGNSTCGGSSNSGNSGNSGCGCGSSGNSNSGGCGCSHH